MVPPGGFEPPTTVPKTAVISISPRRQIFLRYTIIPKLAYNFDMTHMTTQELTKMQIKRIEKEIRDTPYHKGTEHYIGLLRAKLSKLKDKVIEHDVKAKGGGGGGYAVKKQGDATLVLIGPPSAGKSTLINKLTNANSKIAPYAFTTVSVIPGMMHYKNAYIQILDVPGLIEGAEEGKGRGREVLSVARGADLLVLITDTERIVALERIKNALERNGIRINKKHPNVFIDKKLSGGITVHSNIKQDLTDEMIEEIASEFGVKNGDIIIKEKFTLEMLIDSFSRSRVYVPVLEVVNKIDLNNNTEANENIIPISAENNINIDKLKEAIWDKLNLINIYLVKPDEDPGTDNPMVIKKGLNIRDVLTLLGEDFAQNKNKVVIWGSGAKYPAQEVSFSTQVQEGMMIRFL